MSPPFGWMMVPSCCGQACREKIGSDATHKITPSREEGRKESTGRLSVRPTSFVCFFRCVSGCSSEKKRDSSRSAAIEAMPNCQRMPCAVHGDESRAQHGSIQLVNTRDGTSTNFKKRMNGRCRVRKPLAWDLPCVSGTAGVRQLAEVLLLGVRTLGSCHAAGNSIAIGASICSLLP
jgi:hypothetical protein